MHIYRVSVHWRRIIAKLPITVVICLSLILDGNRIRVLRREAPKIVDNDIESLWTTANCLLLYNTIFLGGKRLSMLRTHRPLVISFYFTFIYGFPNGIWQTETMQDKVF